MNSTRRYIFTIRARAPLIAIVGSGPAGFYTAQRLIKKLPGTKVDMYEALPAPFGLSRYGVAPDHPEVKECEKTFEEVASDPNFNFYGNLSVGGLGPNLGSQACTVPVSSLVKNYDGIVFAYGSSSDRLLDIPGEQLPGVYSAREFVAWYNGHPRFSGLKFPEVEEAEEVTILGVGNVALDVARMLLTPVEQLRKTDMTDDALLALSRSRIKRVHLVGRRGAMQAAFSRKELRELQDLYPAAYFDSKHFPSSLLPLKADNRIQKRMLQTFSAIREMAPSSDPGARAWSLDFLLSPSEFYGSDHVEGTKFVVNELSDPFSEDSKAISTEQVVDIPSQLVFRAVGYKGLPLDGFAELGIKFNERKGCILNDGMGRLKSGEIETPGSKPIVLPGLFCTGWAKNGPVGRIVNSYQDGNDTAENIVSDWKKGRKFLGDDEAQVPQGMVKLQHDIEAGLSNVISWKKWQNINAKEKAAGEKQGRPRVKMVTHKELLKAAKGL